MILSANIKQYRKDNHIAQVEVAEKMHMSQPTYWRTENSDEACAKRLPQIANALGTTPDILQNYHLVQNGNGVVEPAGWVKALVAEKESIIQKQAGEITFLNAYTSYMQSVWNTYGGGEVFSGEH
ncbi:helix-turn-helix domain-containing protein [Spirosoma areae]